MIEIIVALIALAGIICKGQYDNRRARTEDAVIHQQLSDRMSAVEKKLDIYNGYAEKFASSERALTEVKVEVKYIKDKVNELSKSK